MDAKMAKRALIIVSIIILVLGLSFACNMLTSDSSNPTVSNPNEVFLSFDGIEVNNQDLYEKMKTMDGLMHLLNYIDQDLLSDYINAVTQDEIDEEMLRLMYGTTIQEEIDMMSELDKEDRIQNYRDTVLVAGFDPDDQDAVEGFVRLNLAKFNYAMERISTATNDSSYHVSSGDVLVYYENNYLGDIQAIQLRFNSATEYRNVLRHFNLVENYEGGLGLYEGEDPIRDIPSDGFDESNTRLLDDEETLAYYIKMYNYLYQHRDALDETATASDIVGLNSDYFSFNYLDMVTQSQELGDAKINEMAKYLFKDLAETDHDYSVRAKTIGDYRFLYYTLERTAPETFTALTSAEREAIRMEYIESLIDDEMILDIMGTLREESGFEIHDSKLGTQYLRENGFDAFVSNGSGNIIATLNGNTISVDDYFNYMAERVGALYSVEVAKEKYLFASSYFENNYGSNRDVWNNSSELMREHRQHVRSDKSAFGNGVYQMYGFSPQVMSWEEFLFLGYGLSGETAYLRTLVTQRLRNFYINDTVSFAQAEAYINEQYENYFSLDVEHILIYVDLDENFAPDDFDTYLEDLGLFDEIAFNNLKAALEETILEALEDQTMKEIVDEYRHALRGTDEDDSDYSKWARFKNAGLLLKYEELSKEESLNYNNSQNFVEAFRMALVDLYQDYNTAENRDADYLYASELTTTQFGIHMIRAEQGDDFEKPSFVPDANAVAAFNQMKINEMFDLEDDTDLTDEQLAGLEAYYQTTYDRFFTNANFTILMIDALRDGNYTFSQNSAHHSHMLDTIYDLFVRRTFPEVQ